MAGWLTRARNAMDAVAEPFRVRPGTPLAQLSWFGVVVAVARPVLLTLMTLYLLSLFWRFAWIREHDLAYPQKALAADPMVSAQVETEPESGVDAVKSCGRSEIVRMNAFLLDFLVNANDWAPSSIQYKIGWFGLASFSSGPFLDNKANFQIGVLQGLRRSAIELVETIGRVRGTSNEDPDLANARSLLQQAEQTATFNPFSKRLPFGPVTPAHAQYRRAIGLFEAYNDRLAACDALFDARADNLRQFLDRIAKDLGSTVDQLAKRSQGERYDPALDAFVAAEGNDWGWFDWRADDLFYRASGRMYAYHGILQAARLDFAEVIEKRDLGDVWDRMEAHVAHAAALQPLIVSNGREDGAIMPDHLAIMAQSILRARANMTELRDILRN